MAASETFALVVLGIIIVIDLVAVVAIMRIGSVHDHHHDVVRPEESQALARIYAETGFIERSQAASPVSRPAAAAPAVDPVLPATVSDPAPVDEADSASPTD